MIRTIVVTALVIIVSGCAGAGTSVSPAPSSRPVIGTSAFDVEIASPGTCDEGVHVLFRKRNAAFHVPPCGGWKGLIQYPGNGKLARWTITSSVTNDFGAPPPPSGTAIFYMQMEMRHPVITNFPNGGVNDTVTSPALTADHTYTLNVYNFLYNEQCPSMQCTWTLNVGSPQQGSHSISFTSPLNGATVLGGNTFAPVWQFVEN